MQRHSNDQKAVITIREIQRTFSFQNAPVLSLSIRYPQVLVTNRVAQLRINNHIRSQITQFMRFASTSLYRDAVANLHYAQENGYPFHPFEAVLNYTVTYNQGCHLSMYRDQYTFTGGAHGNTVRSSDTYSLRTGATLPLYSYFQPYQNYRRVLITAILRQADENMKQDPIYFENYPLLIMRYFNEENYYLSPEGLCLYFQQYEIAPYSTGIVVFTVPFSLLHWYPVCVKPV